MSDGVAGPGTYDTMNVRVAVRVRPVLPKEKAEKCAECVRVLEGNQVVIGANRSFTFDYAFQHNSSQSRIYEQTVRNLVDGCFEGYNATVLAYGQTGSGKTFTMGTGNGYGISDDEMGIIPRVIRQIFETIQQKKGTAQFLVRVSYLEIYNEDVKDLLHPETPSKSIAIREDANGGILVVGVQEEAVNSFDEMMTCLENGSVHRTTGSTLMNEQSSRSHSIFTVVLEQKHIDGTSDEYMSAKFHLVDLAGSERAKRTGAVGFRFKESVAINCGLLALGNVISALGDEKKKGAHVPYRESKLTRLLQDSLGGNSRTLMIACVSPADINFEETLNTLKYANRARNIRNKPVINRDPQSAQLVQMKDEIAQLQLELMRYRAESGHPETDSDVRSVSGIQELSVELVGAKEKIKTLQSEKDQLTMRLQDSESSIIEISDDLFSIQKERDELKSQMGETLGYLKEVTHVLESLEHVSAINGTLKAKMREARDHIQTTIQRSRQYARDRGNESVEQMKRPSTAPVKAKNRSKSVMIDPAAVQDLNSTVQQDVLKRYLDSIAKLEKEVGELRVELRQKNDELMEAKDDLNRDEEIFAEKLEEMQRQAEEHERLKAELRDLQVRAQNQESESAYKSSAVGSAVSSRPATSASGISSAMPWMSFAEKVEDEDEVQYGDDEGQWEEMQGRSTVSANNAAKINDNIEKLEQERQRLLIEKKSLEEEKVHIESSAQMQLDEYERNQKRMDKLMRDLTINIRMKEELIRELVKSEQESNLLKQQYEARIHEMEEDLKTSKVELEKLMREIDSTQSILEEKKEEEKNRLKQMYESKLRVKEEQLLAMKKKQKEQEKLVKLKTQSDRKIQELNNEVGRMKQQQVDLKRKMKEDQDKYNDFESNKAKELAKLKKEADLSQRRIKELESENVKQRMVLRKKEEEISSAHKKLRENEEYSRKLTRTPSTASGMSDRRGHMVPSRSNSASSLPMLPGSAPGSSHGSVSPGTAEIERKKAWLDKEIDNYMKQKDSMEQLERELSKREAIIKKKETYLQQRTNLEYKKMRTSQVVSQSIADLSKTIDALNRELNEREETLHVAGGSNEKLQGLNREIAQLKSKREEAERQRSRLEHRQQFMTSEEDEALGEINDRIEALDAEIEYKNMAIDSVRKDLNQGRVGSPDDLVNRLDNLTAMELKQVVKRYWEKIIELTSEEKQSDSRIHILEAELVEKKHQLEEVENSIRVLEIEHDRRNTQMQRDHEAMVQSLLKQLESGVSGATVSDFSRPVTAESERGEEGRGDLNDKEYVSKLEKDNYYYRQTNRELKRKLRELMSSTEKHQQMLDSERDTKKELFEMNGSLMKELQNLKSYLHKHKTNLQPVRISKSELKQISEDELANRSHTRASNASFTSDVSHDHVSPGGRFYPPPPPRHQSNTHPYRDPYTDQDNRESYDDDRDVSPSYDSERNRPFYADRSRPSTSGAGGIDFEDSLNGGGVRRGSSRGSTRQY
eukprot:GILK01009374.1.p1 GENE.GILK01009374.1~~GILK01009374.1.p1  ORF type:complete len:1490 (-),score=407.64 GILK01009374.1:108-4577(-)